jgi:ParB family chromosome partitioning protein
MTAGKRGRKTTETTRKTRNAPRKGAASRKTLAPSREKRGLEAGEIRLQAEAAEVAPLAAEVRAAGGTEIGGYREPLSGRPLLLAALPVAGVHPTPFQRDLSPTHVKRLAAKIEESGSFLDPLIVVRGADGRLWTPNGRHRLAAAKLLGLRQIMALVSPDEDLAFRILALNTEKAHNLKDRSLEVIRMARELAERKPRARESDFAAEFEAAELLTLGIIYEEEGRFAGGAYSPFLKKVDRFSDRALKASLRERGGYAARLLEIERGVRDVLEELRARLQVAVPQDVRRGAHQPGAVPPREEGRGQAGDGLRRGPDADERGAQDVRRGLGQARRPRPGRGRGERGHRVTARRLLSWSSWSTARSAVPGSTSRTRSTSSTTTASGAEPYTMMSDTSRC